MKTVIIGSLVAFTSLAQAQTFATDFNSISDAIVDSHVLTGSVGSFSAGATTGAAADIAIRCRRVLLLP